MKKLILLVITFLIGIGITGCSGQKLTIHFTADDGAYSITETDHRLEIMIPEFEKEGYEFEGFYLEETFETEFTLDNSFEETEFTVYGKFVIKSYFVYYEMNGGEAVEPLEVEFDDHFVPEIFPVKEGFELDNYYYDEALTEPFLFETMPAHDITLYASWTPLPEETIKIGVIGPMTGDYSIYGMAVQRGAELAIKEINEQGGLLGQQLELVVGNSQGDASQGVQEYHRLLEDEGMQALIGPTFSGVSLSIKNLIKVDGIPMITPTATNPEVTLDAENIFRACYTDYYQGAAAAEFVYNSLGMTKVAVLYHRDDQYSVELKSAFVERFNELGGETELYDYNYSTTDFSVFFEMMSEFNPEIIYLPAYLMDAVNILEASDAFASEIPFIGGDGWDGIEIEFGTLAEGNYYLSHYASDDPLYLTFEENYLDEFGEEPNALSVLAYDAMMALAEVINEADSMDNAAITELLSMMTFEGYITGLTSFDSDGNAVKDIPVTQIVNGEKVSVE